ncbi:SEC-C metal-binding domain-containing protein [Phaeobacter sp. JH209B]|uniref:SEC-C metal-binding domain-containing protein n=1 Tax=Phaeobacter sp. JH209B TaxID=3112506 RepID=UPI003A83C9D5
MRDKDYEVIKMRLTGKLPVDYQKTMKTHPSLAAPKFDFNSRSLNPIKKMGRNERCWCNSGRKFKNCHLNRESQKKQSPFEHEQAMFSELRKGYCAYPASLSRDPCSDTIIKAHTIQKAGGLAAIAESNHVLTVKPVMSELIKTKGNPQPRKIGVKLASVFPGFCSKHDNDLFEPIEGKTLNFTKESAFLFSYRAVAYERFAKEAQQRFMLSLREADAGMPFQKQAALQQFIQGNLFGIEIGMRDVQKWKAQFDEKLLSSSTDQFHFAAVRFDRILPIVACGAFHPEFDCTGLPLQKLGQDRVELDQIALTVTTFDSQTVVVFGWIGNQEGPARSLVNSFLAIEDSRKADALVRLLFIHTDNLFLRPSWWEGLPESSQKALNDMSRSGTVERQRTGKEYANDALKLISANTVEQVSG